MQRDSSFTLRPDLFRPIAPFTAAHDPKRPFRWVITDALGIEAADARTRAGARAALRALHCQTRSI